MRRFRSDQGLASWIVGVTFTLGVIAVVAWMYMEVEVSSLVRERDSLKAQAQAVEASRRPLNDQAILLSMRLGLANVQKIDDLDVAQAKTILDEMKKQAKVSAPDATLELTIRGAEIDAQTAAATARELTLRKDIAEAAAKSAVKQFDDVKAVKAATQQTLSDESEALSKTFAELSEQYDKLTQDRGDRLKALKEEAESTETAAIRRTLELQNEISRKKADLMKAQQREARVVDILKPQGEIVDVEPRGRYATISLGAKDHVVPGMRFRVFRIAAGGAVVLKGLLETKQVFDDHTRCAVLIGVRFSDPVARGDRIGNPLWDARRTLEVAVVGDVDARIVGMGRNELIRRLKLKGVRVADTVSDGTEFVLLGSSGSALDNDAQYQRALSLQVPLVPAASIVDMLGD